MAKKSPTQRALELLRKEGYTAAVVERWNVHAKIRQDMLGFIDVVYLTGSSIVGVQVTSASNHAARRSKILAEPRAKLWLQSRGLIEVWSFAKRGARGQVKRWEVRKEEITLADFGGSDD